MKVKDLLEKSKATLDSIIFDDVNGVKDVGELMGYFDKDVVSFDMINGVFYINTLSDILGEEVVDEISVEAIENEMSPFDDEQRSIEGANTEDIECLEEDIESEED